MASPQPAAPKRTLLTQLWTWLRALPGVTLGRFVKFAIKAALVAAALFAIFFIYTTWPGSLPTELPTDSVAYLDAQGWGAAGDSPVRQAYYFTPQGANVKQLRYSWFVNLEKAWSSQRLAAPENMRNYRFIVDPTPTRGNPDQLPLGFARFSSAVVGDDLLDISCAACHSGELHAASGGKRVAIRIDGGQAMHAFTSPARGQFLSDLNSSLMATYFNPLKFTSFAKKVLGNTYPQGYFKLHGELRKVWWAVFTQGMSDRFHNLYPTEEGFGRTDAVQRISNNVFGAHIDSANLRVGNGPVSYPPVWNIWKFDWVQYGAEARQPLARNLGETLGVGADYKLVADDGSPLPPDSRFSTSTAVNNLIVLEDALKQLNPPKWPENILGPIDCDRARAGKEYFGVFCAHCHGPNTMPGLEAEFKWWMAPLKGKNDPLWAISVIPLSAIGTDPNAATNFFNNRYDLSKTGMAREEIRRAMLPELAQDEERRIEFLRAEVAKAGSKLDCRAAYNVQAAKAALDAANAGPCFDALSKLEKVPRPANCQGGPLAALNGFDCAAAVRAYDQAVWDIAAQGAQVCPNIRRAIESVDIASASGGAGLNYVGTLMAQKYFRENGILSDAEAQMSGYGTLDLPQVVLGYKPRPLAGVWATPPYLHNGSVPTLYELLSPASKRSARFISGDRSFDPVKVGLATVPEAKNSWWFDARLSGNSNAGHEFRAGYVEPCSIDSAGAAHMQYQNGVIGPELTDEIRFAIIEYLKIKDDDNPDHELPARCSSPRTTPRAMSN